MKPIWFFSDEVFAAACAVLVWVMMWGAFDLGLREPPHIWIPNFEQKSEVSPARALGKVRGRIDIRQSRFQAKDQLGRKIVRFLKGEKNGSAKYCEQKYPQKIDGQDVRCKAGY